MTGIDQMSKIRGQDGWRRKALCRIGLQRPCTGCLLPIPLWNGQNKKHWAYGRNPAALMESSILPDEICGRVRTHPVALVKNSYMATAPQSNWPYLNPLLGTVSCVYPFQDWDGILWKNTRKVLSYLCARRTDCPSCHRGWVRVDGKQMCTLKLWPGMSW